MAHASWRRLLTRKRDPMGTATRYYMFFNATKALTTWRDGLMPAVDGMAVAKRFFSDRHLSKAFEGWEANAKALAYERELRSRTKLFFRSRLPRGFYVWAAEVAAQATLTQKQQHGVGYFFNRRLALGLASWKRGPEGGRRAARPLPSRRCVPRVAAVAQAC